eukprot:365019-Chlamydomonas_euryale.AAC.23
MALRGACMHVHSAGDRAGVEQRVWNLALTSRGLACGPTTNQFLSGGPLTLTRRTTNPGGSNERGVCGPTADAARHACMRAPHIRPSAWHTPQL